MHRRDVLASAAGLAGLPLCSRATDGGDPSIEPLAELEIPMAVDFKLDAAAETAYVTARDGFLVVDVSDPASPVVLAERRGLLADYDRGPLTYVRDASVDGDRMLLTAHMFAGYEDEIHGAIVLYDVSDPAAPERLAVRKTDYPVHNGTLEDGTAVVTGTSLRRWPAIVLDASDGLTEIARWSVVDADERWGEVDPSIRRLHDVYLRDDVAYLAHFDAGVWLLDVSDPTHPTPTAHFDGRDPDDVLADGRRAIAQTLELPASVAESRPNGDGSLVSATKEASDDVGTVEVGGPGGVDVFRVDESEKAVTLAAPRFGETRHSKNHGWRGDRLFVAFRDGGVRAYDLADVAEPMLLAEWRNVGADDFHTARPLADGFAGLTFLGDPDTERTPRLYTFPEPSVDGAVPAPTGPPSAQSPVSTPSPTPAPTRTASPTGRTTSTASPTATTTGEQSDPSTATTETGAPGFAIVGTVAAGVLAGLRLVRRS